MKTKPYPRKEMLFWLRENTKPEQWVDNGAEKERITLPTGCGWYVGGTAEIGSEVTVNRSGNIRIQANDVFSMTELTRVNVEKERLLDDANTHAKATVTRRKNRKIGEQNLSRAKMITWLQENTTQEQWKGDNLKKLQLPEGCEWIVGTMSPSKFIPCVVREYDSTEDSIVVGHVFAPFNDMAKTCAEPARPADPRMNRESMVEWLKLNTSRRQWQADLNGVELPENCNWRIVHAPEAGQLPMVMDNLGEFLSIYPDNVFSDLTPSTMVKTKPPVRPMSAHEFDRKLGYLNGLLDVHGLDLSEWGKHELPHNWCWEAEEGNPNNVMLHQQLVGAYYDYDFVKRYLERPKRVDEESIQTVVVDEDLLIKLPEHKPLPKPKLPMTATEMLIEASTCIGDRAIERDTDAERSMKATVDAFNAMYQLGMSEEMGWMFMVFLKAARAKGGKFRDDNYIDGASYFALAGECAGQHRG